MTLAVRARLPVLPRKTINSCSFAVPGKWGSYKLPDSSAFGDAPGGIWDPIPGHTRRPPHTRHRPQHAGRTPPHQLSLAPAPLAATTPRGRQGRTLFRKALGPRARPPPGWGARVGAAPVGSSGSTIPEIRLPVPKPRAPHLVAEASGHQQVRAGRAVAAHGLLAAGAGQRVRHVEQGVGPGGRQALGGPARHGAHGSGRAAAASSCARRGGLPQRPRPGPARPRSVGGPSPAGLGAAAAAARRLVSGGAGPGRAAAGLGWAALGWAGLLGSARPRSAPEPAAVRSHLGRGRPARSATPPSPLAAPPPRRLGRPWRGKEAGAEGRRPEEGGEGDEEARPKPRPCPPPAARRPAGSAP